MFKYLKSIFDGAVTAKEHADANWFNEPAVENKKIKSASDNAIFAKLAMESGTLSVTKKQLIARDDYVIRWPTIHVPPRITSKYGIRYLNVNGSRQKNFHIGVDFGTSEEVLAVEDMIIDKVLDVDAQYPSRFTWSTKKNTWVQTAPKNRAWTPFIKAVGVFSKNLYNYKHVKPAPGVEPGKKYKAGDIIGTAGNYGYSLGSHLHFEIYPYSETQKQNSAKEFTNWPDTIDPLVWLNKKVKLEDKILA